MAPERPRVESRWPPLLVVVGLLGALALLPSRVRLLPPWVPWVIGTGLAAPMAGVALTGGHKAWRRVEHASTLGLSVLTEVVTLATLAFLIHQMLEHPADVSGRLLFTSAVAAWVTNVVVFALLYWRIDRGGPEARANGAAVPPDWLFPQAAPPQAATPGWRPAFVDYLFVAFTAAAAFSPADALPLTSRAKLLMLAESAVSLATLVVVASRAIGLLGG